MKNKYLLTLYLISLITSSIFYVPSINYLNGNIQFVNLFTSNEPIDFKRYIIIQIVCLLTFILLNKIIGNIDFNIISWFLKFKNRLYRISLFLMSILFCYLLYVAYDQFIIKPQKIRENEIARIARNKKDSLENLKLEEQRQQEESIRKIKISLACTEENAMLSLKKWVKFYHKDSKIISKIDMIEVYDCTFKASFRITETDFPGILNQSVVCRIELNPEQYLSGRIYVEEGYFY